MANELIESDCETTPQAKVRLQAKQSAVPSGSPTGPRAASPATGTASTSQGTAIPSYASVTSAGPPVQETPEQKEHAQHHFASTADLEANKAAVAGRRYTVFGKNRSRVKTASAVDILRATLEKEGVTGWYKGMQAQILKAVLSQGERAVASYGTGTDCSGPQASSSWPRVSSRRTRSSSFCWPSGSCCAGWRRQRRQRCDERSRGGSPRCHQ